MPIMIDGKKLKKRYSQGKEVKKVYHNGNVVYSSSVYPKKFSWSIAQNTVTKTYIMADYIAETDGFYTFESNHPLDIGTRAYPNLTVNGEITAPMSYVTSSDSTRFRVSGVPIQAGSQVTLRLPVQPNTPGFIVSVDITEDRQQPVTAIEEIIPRVWLPFKGVLSQNYGETKDTRPNPMTFTGISPALESLSDTNNVMMIYSGIPMMKGGANWSMGGTVGAWVRDSNRGAGQRWILHYKPASNIRFETYVTYSEVDNYVTIGGRVDNIWTDNRLVFPLNDGKWHFVAATLQRNVSNWTLRLFIDGYTAEKVFANSAYGSFYDCNVQLTNTEAEVDMDDVFLVDRVLGVATLNRLYNSPMVDPYEGDRKFGRSGSAKTVIPVRTTSFVDISPEITIPRDMTAALRMLDLSWPQASSSATREFRILINGVQAAITADEGLTLSLYSRPLAAGDKVKFQARSASTTSGYKDVTAGSWRVVEA